MLISLRPSTVFATTLVGLTRLPAKYKRSATFLTHHLRSLTIAQTSEDKLTYTRHEPIGVVVRTQLISQSRLPLTLSHLLSQGQIIPWNFPCTYLLCAASTTHMTLGSQ